MGNLLTEVVLSISLVCCNPVVTTVQILRNIAPTLGEEEGVTSVYKFLVKLFCPLLKTPTRFRISYILQSYTFLAQDKNFYSIFLNYSIKS